MGTLVSCPSHSGPGDGLRWRVLIELTGSDGSVRLDEVIASGDRPVDPLADSPIGPTVGEGKTILAGVRARPVEAEAAAF
jgi:hypothetical protein